MRKIALLTMDSLDGFYAYDYMLEPYFSEHGWHAEHVSWHNPQVLWDDYEVVIVRSTWDYQQAPEAFFECLQRIEASSAVLENPLALMHWNLEKTYLKTLQRAGIPTIPTLWLPSFEADMLQRAVQDFACEMLVVKPVVSANADHTYKLGRNDVEAFTPILADVFAQRPLMIQPFLASIQSQGEVSLFYFDGKYSHAILKRPKQDDFRVQEEHGGQLALLTPTTDMLEIAEKTLRALPEVPLYARIDLVYSREGFAVIEVELIEPSLYFNMDPLAAKRFVDAFVVKYGVG